MSHRGGSKSVRNQDWDTDCTPDCTCPKHASVILTSVALGNLRLVQHCSNLCSNAWRIADPFGRTPLHVAASRGHLDIVEWLVARKRVGVDTVDGESGWSALHRSVYFGELGTAVSLTRHGAGLGVRDRDGLTPLSLLNKDRLQLGQKLDVTATDVYTWGSNANTTLGHAHSRPHPERLELPSQYTITQVLLEKFHSVLLTSCGEVLTCGHGRGGRLGHGNEASVVSPRVVEGLKGETCVSVAAARNHTVFLTHSGVVYTCGLNDAHQLGIGTAPNTAPKQCLLPTPITAKVLRGRHIRGIGAGRYHTALCTASHVYTFGQNLGQLGYEKNYTTQILPKAMPQISVDGDDSIVSLSASHAATAVLTKRQRIFVCCDFTVKSLRCGFLEKLQCRVFQVCASLTDRAHLRGTSPEPTKILLLDTEHKLWYWEPGKKGTVPYILPGLAKYNVSHFTLGKNLTIVTEEGEVYLSMATSGQPLSFTRLSNVQNARAVFTDFKATNFAYLQNVNGVLGLPTVAPPTLTSDLCSLLKEGDLPDSVADMTLQSEDVVVPAHRYILSLLSSHPLTSPSHTLPSSPPHIIDAFLHYLYGAEVRLIPIPDQSNTDTTSYLAAPTSGPNVELTPDTSFASIDENDLTEMYDQFSNQVPQRCNTEENGFDELEINLSDEFGGLRIRQSTPRKGRRKTVSRDSVKVGVGEGVMGGGGGEVLEVMCACVRKDLQSLLKLASDLQVSSLKTKLDNILSNFSLKQALHSVILTPPPLSLSPSLSPTLTDVTIHTSDHQSLHCHKCILVARSDYFKSMLLMGWRESSEGSSSLSLPFSHDLLTTVIHYMYSDAAPSVTNSDSLQWIVEVLVIADQLLLTRLRDICEQTLAKKLTLRSVCDILEVAATCSAPQLKRACLQFIGVNAAALLEGRFLDGLSSPLLTELSSVYKEMIPTISKRIIKFPDPDPSGLPESYFMEGGGGRGGSPEEQEGSEREENLKSPTHHSPVNMPHSSGRRRRRDARRRRSSQSDAKKTHSSRGSISPSPTPISPPLTPSPLPTSPLPTSPLPTSPLLALSPNSPEEILTTEGVGSSKSVRVGSNRNESNKIQTTPSVSNEPGPRGSGDTASSSLRGSGQLHNKLSRKRLMDSYCDNSVTERGRGGEEEEGVSSHKLTNGISSPGQTRKVWGGGGGGGKGGIAVHPNQTDTVRVAWNKSPPSDSGVEGGKPVSLRDIMAEEERERQQASSTHHTSSDPHTGTAHKVTSVPSAPSRRHSHPHRSHSHTLTGVTHHTSPPPPSLGSQHSSPRSLPASRQSSLDQRGRGEGEGTPLSSSVPHSPGNPWHTAHLSTSPVVSLRALMAEETQRAEQRKKKTSRPPPLSSSPSSPHTTSPSSRHTQRVEERRRPAVQQTTHPVSFAAIIRSQQREQETQRLQAGKPLSCIQIEQQAINQLEALYNCHGNPDEYITVRRHRLSGHTPSLHHCPVSHAHSSTTSPWNMR